MRVPKSGPWVALEWNSSNAPNAVGYNVYRSRISGGPYVKINSKLDPQTYFSDYWVTEGRTYYYVTTTVNSEGHESLYSNEAEVYIPDHITKVP